MRWNERPSGRQAAGDVLVVCHGGSLDPRDSGTIGENHSHLFIPDMSSVCSLQRLHLGGRLGQEGAVKTDQLTLWHIGHLYTRPTGLSYQERYAMHLLCVSLAVSLVALPWWKCGLCDSELRHSEPQRQHSISLKRKKTETPDTDLTPDTWQWH